MDSLGLPTPLLRRSSTATRSPTAASSSSTHQTTKEQRERLKEEQALLKARTKSEKEAKEIAKSDFWNHASCVEYYADMTYEKIQHHFSQVTVGDHLRPLCKEWHLPQSGRKDEVIKRLCDYIRHKLARPDKPFPGAVKRQK